MEKTGRTESAAARPSPGHGAHATTYVCCIVVTRLVSQRPMSWLKDMASWNLHAMRGGGGKRDAHVRCTGQDLTPQPAAGRTRHRPVQHARPANPSREPAGRPRGVQRRQETYVSCMFATRAVSQSARLLLKSSASSNMDRVVVAEDTSQLGNK